MLPICCFALLLGSACNRATTPTTVNTATPKLPAILQTALTAHGGLERWNDFNTFEKYGLRTKILLWALMGKKFG